MGRLGKHRKNIRTGQSQLDAGVEIVTFLDFGHISALEQCNDLARLSEKTVRVGSAGVNQDSKFVYLLFQI